MILLNWYESLFNQPSKYLEEIEGFLTGSSGLLLKYTSEVMKIADIDYLEHLSETSAIHLSGGGNAVAISGFWALALGPSTYTAAVANNQAVTRPNTSFASSSVQVIAVSSGGSAFASAFSSASSSS